MPRTAGGLGQPLADAPTPGRPRQRRRRSGWSGFADRYGWRAYALPVLTLITIVAAARGTGGPPHQAAAAAGARVQVEGGSAGDARFQAGSTPSPVTITLKSDTATTCATNTYAKLILVSVSKQHLWACDGAKQVNETPVTTGKVTDDDQTPLGSWRVQAKQRDRYLVGPGYKDYVHYWVPFNGDFGLHDAPWQTMPFGSKDWRTQGSHGCVHTPTATMAWLYNWVQVASTVVTIES